MIVILSGCTAAPAGNQPLNPNVNDAVKTPAVSVKKTYTLTEIAAHNKTTDCWYVIGNKVYDVSAYTGAHPGGPNIINGCGKESTSLYNSVGAHSRAQAVLDQYLIGTINP